LQPEPSDSLRLAIKEIALHENIPYYDTKIQTGFLITLGIRTATTREVMVILQVTSFHEEWLEKILGMIAEKFPQVNSLNYLVNAKKKDTYVD
jgi:23S rRNA (uracil1939-C5)-methyltransferase